MPMPIRFGATDTLACIECKKGMRVTRRTPHPTLGNEFELQTFTCWGCRLTVERTADRQGEITI